MAYNLFFSDLQLSSFLENIVLKRRTRLYNMPIINRININMRHINIENFRLTNFGKATSSPPLTFVRNECWKRFFKVPLYFKSYQTKIDFI